MIPKEIIIIGGGTSIKEGISIGLKEKLQNKFVITCNFSCYHFDSTFTTYIDKNFYLGDLNPAQIKEKNQNHIEKLKSLPLIVGNKFTEEKQYYYPNTIPVKQCGTYYHENILENGFYSGGLLCGIFAISLAMYLINYSGVLYCLGFDWTKEGNTHYYSKEEINHRGQGFTKFYKSHNPQKYFEPFTKEKNIKIYNVSPSSNINCFEKIDYTTFFSKLNNVVYNQNELREYVKGEFLCTK